MYWRCLTEQPAFASTLANSPIESTSFSLMCADPEVQYPYYPEMAYNNTYGVKAINFVEYKLMKWAAPGCVKSIQACQNDTSKCTGAQEGCNLKMTTPYQLSGLNPYDVCICCCNLHSANNMLLLCAEQ